MSQTPKEKAKELYCKYRDSLNIRDLQTNANPFAKQCALIAVDEIIDILEINGFRLQEYHDKGTLEYWIHVIDELKNL
jgi:hypothetical protein